MTLSARLQTFLIIIVIVIGLGTWWYLFWSTRFGGPAIDTSIDDILHLTWWSNLVLWSWSLTWFGVSTQSTWDTANILTLYIPESRYTPAWSRVITALSGYHITLQIVTYRGHFFQKKLIDQDMLSDEIDIILIDTDHVSALSGWAQAIIWQEDMVSFVHPILSQTLKQYPYRFPRWLDLAVVWSDVPPSRSMTLEYMLNMQSLIPNQNTIYIPILVWEQIGDQQLIAQKIHPILDPALLTRLHDHNNTTPAYTAITQSVLRNNNKYRSSGYLIKIADYLIKKDPDCADMVWWCMLSRKMTSAVLWWMSDEYHISTMMDDSIVPQIFPHRTQTYPCKWRWFIINKKSLHKQQALVLLKYLISRLNNLDFDLYDHNLSAYQQLLNIQIQWPKWKSWTPMIQTCRISS